MSNMAVFKWKVEGPTEAVLVIVSVAACCEGATRSGFGAGSLRETCMLQNSISADQIVN